MRLECFVTAVRKLHVFVIMTSSLQWTCSHFRTTQPVPSLSLCVRHLINITIHPPLSPLPLHSPCSSVLSFLLGCCFSLPPLPLPIAFSALFPVLRLRCTEPCVENDELRAAGFAQPLSSWVRAPLQKTTTAETCLPSLHARDFHRQQSAQGCNYARRGRHAPAVRAVLARCVT